MKFIQKWFAGICEDCTDLTHVREVRDRVDNRMFLCQICDPAEEHWFNGKCEECGCEGSVQKDVLTTLFRCYKCMSGVNWRFIDATSSERR